MGLLLYFKFFLFFLILTTKAAAKRRRNFKIVVLAANCDILTPKIQSLKCYASYIKKRSAVNVELILNEDIPDIKAHIKCTMIRQSQRDFNMIDTEVDVCQLFAFNTRGSLMQLITKEFKQVGVNLDKGCPLKANTSYAIKEFHTDASFFPQYSPDFNYTLNLEFYSGLEKFAVYKSFGALCKKQKYCEKFK